VLEPPEEAVTAYHQLEAPPVFEPGEAATILADVFGVVGALGALPADRDLNFRVGATDGTRYVLKFSNPADVEPVLDMQRAVMSHIRSVDPSLPIGSTVPTLDGAGWQQTTAHDGRRSFVRLFTHLDGHHAGIDELGHDALRDWGSTLARLARAMRGFFHPAAGYEVQWDLRHTPRLRSRLPDIDPEHRAIVTEVLDRYDERVAPIQRGLRAQVVHDDMCPDNVLVDDRGAITGILDFGDMTHTALVNDLASSVADTVGGRADALESAVAILSGYHSVTPLEPAEAAVLADLVAARCAMTVLLTIPVPAEQASSWMAAEAWELLQDMADHGFDAVGARFAEAVADAADGGSAATYAPRPTPDLLAARRRTLGPLELSYEHPLHLVRGRGVFLFGSQGETYLDAYNNVPVLGHSHPALVRAVTSQLERLNTNTRYLHEAATTLAERLLASAPGMERVLFVNSGSEANDLALRIARRATGARGAMATSFAYHGVTEATTDVSPETWPAGHRPDHVRLLPPPGRTEPADVAPLSRELATGVEELRANGAGLAVAIVDSAFISDGILGPAHDWVRTLGDAVHAAGGLLVADEVQSGYGRTGDGLWGHAGAGVAPDLITLGKPMGSGFPVAALLTRAELADEFIESTDYFSTFGGNTVACAAALAVLDVIDEEGLVERARSVGSYLRTVLCDVADRHSSLAAVRSWGLLAGIDIVSDEHQPDPDRARRVANRMRDLGVLIGTTGPRSDVLKIRPPLVFERAHVDLLAERLDQAMADTAGQA
jgi:4-aminobutyrate aminotransferase-like enzyme/Ser/Thr protein kinase RdoA (MazF antagonist)